MPTVSPTPPLQEPQRRRQTAILINEYAWLWLTRDGQPTCLTDPVYAQLLGPNATVEQRRELYARTLAAKTEFWRAGRKCAGVLHFCLLGYSRPGDLPRPVGGATSDHWADVEKLTFERKFYEFVRESFAPVGIMADFWADTVSPGEQREVAVVVTNDLGQRQTGRVRLRVLAGSRAVFSANVAATVEPWAQSIARFTVPMPRQPGDYRLEASLAGGVPEKVRSLRDFKVVAPASPN
jgi:hypothetical protein